MFHQRFRCLLIYALFLSSLFILYIIWTHRIRTEQTRMFGHYNSLQIIARTEPLCSLFTNQTNDLRFSASKLEYPGESIRRFWEVDCTDAAGNFVASFTWDAESGDLYLVGHHSLRRSVRGTVPLTCSQAIQITQRWMGDLGISEQSCKWRLARPPEQIHNIWHVTWQAEGRTAFIQIDIHSGDLLQARSWRQNRHGNAL